MAYPTFGSLVDVLLLEAWEHEAHRFTPCLAENFDRLDDVIGIPPELAGPEMPCGASSEDIVGRNACDDSIVLIEKGSVPLLRNCELPEHNRFFR